MSSELKFEKNMSAPDAKEEEDFVFQDYLDALLLSLDDIKGKKILDVGAAEGGFAAACRKRGIETEIISLDPSFLTRDKNGGIPKMKGIAELLPLKSDSFDLVISAFAVPGLLSPEKIKIAINEMLRVVRKRGELRFTPATFYKIGPKNRDLTSAELDYNVIIMKNLLDIKDKGFKLKFKKLESYKKESGNIGITVAIIEKR